MKSAYLAALLLCSTAGKTFCQQQDSLATQMQNYFNEAATATQLQKQIWGIDLYGPMLLVNPATREIITNMPDSSGKLQKQGSVYTGNLPKQFNTANTSFHWEGRDWAMLQLPLPTNKAERVNLMAHELFHRAQPSLHFTPQDPTNNHLDKKDGRLYLRLELNALQKALQATSSAERRQHLTNAMTFRQYRYILFPGADTTENALELNEGIAEYTGMMVCNRNKQDAQTHFGQYLQSFLEYPTFVRSFPYQTIPVYGYLLAQATPGWNRLLNSHSQLTPLLIKGFHLTMPKDIKAAALAQAGQYDAAAIIVAETAREVRIQEQISAYTRIFITQPHTDLRFEKMSVSFNPSNIVPLEGYGTVYPTMRISDKWGILTVTNGALMGTNWDKVTVSLPQAFTVREVSGQGWKLQLNEGYTLSQDANGNYSLKKN